MEYLSTLLDLSLGGQTAINLAQPLMDRGVKIIGTDCEAIERAENRDSFEKVLVSLKEEDKIYDEEPTEIDLSKERLFFVSS